MLRMRSGNIHEYNVIMAEDTVIVTGKHGMIVAHEKVKGLGDFISRAEDLRIGWGELPDFEVIYIYDKADNNFGYAVNITDGQLSEWGYAPFSVEL